MSTPDKNRPFIMQEACNPATRAVHTQAMEARESVRHTIDLLEQGIAERRELLNIAHLELVWLDRVLDLDGSVCAGAGAPVVTPPPEANGTPKYVALDAAIVLALTGAGWTPRNTVLDLCVERDATLSAPALGLRLSALVKQEVLVQQGKRGALEYRLKPAAPTEPQLPLGDGNASA